MFNMFRRTEAPHSREATFSVLMRFLYALTEVFVSDCSLMSGKAAAVRRVESRNGVRRNILTGPLNIFTGPLWGENFWIFLF